LASIKYILVNLNWIKGEKTGKQIIFVHHFKQKEKKPSLSLFQESWKTFITV
jgi:hypothetical protein